MWCISFSWNFTDCWVDGKKHNSEKKKSFENQTWEKLSFHYLDLMMLDSVLFRHELKLFSPYTLVFTFDQRHRCSWYSCHHCVYVLTFSFSLIIYSVWIYTQSTYWVINQCVNLYEHKPDLNCLPADNLSIYCTVNYCHFVCYDLFSYLSSTSQYGNLPTDMS